MPVYDAATIQTMLVTMGELQERHNTQVASDWRERGFAYYRAIWVECAELLDHYGWKWWKAQQPDLDQVKLELVDIWHFGLSILLREGALDTGLASRVSQTLNEGAQANADPDSFREAVETLASAAVARKTFDVEAFLACMRCLGMDFEELQQLYVGKNVLNTFRQDHGYAAGTYAKTWQGREDNEHLVEVVAGLDPASSDYAAQVYEGLAERYPG